MSCDLSGQHRNHTERRENQGRELVSSTKDSNPSQHEATDEQPAEIVIINPVSRLHAYCSKQEFNQRWERR